MPKQSEPSFAERTESMRVVANNLLATANLLTKFAQEIAAEGMEGIALDSAVSDSDVKTFLSEIDSEIQVEMGSELPSVVPEGKINELEKELDRLRQND